MTFSLQSDHDVYCWLKNLLEPVFRVVTEPATSYFLEHQYRYVIWYEQEKLFELTGDFRIMQPGTLVQEANRILAELRADPRFSNLLINRLEPLQFEQEWFSQGNRLIASRLPPRQSDRTWFCTGRAAFAWLMENVVRARMDVRRIWLPTFCCWSLIDTVVRRLPDIELLFYPVNPKLQCEYPEIEPGDVLLYIHYFGHRNFPPEVPAGAILLEDDSHVLIPSEPASGHFGFGSLRKVFRIADGGFIYGEYHPVYEPSRNLPAWLRRNARDWRDLREAENMQDRETPIADMSSQSMAAMAQYDLVTSALQRQQNEQYLRNHFPAGEPLVSFRNDEVPLLHNIVLKNQSDRDSLKSFLAERAIFCSIHWPVHPLVRQHSNQAWTADAIWLEEHVLSIPIAEFDRHEMVRICETAEDWLRGAPT